MRYRGTLTIPTNTLATAPVSVVVPLTYGKITQVDVLFPAGHSGLTQLRIYYHERQIIPASPEAYLIGDDHMIPIQERFPIYDEPFEVTLVGCSPGSVLSHTIYVDFTVEAEIPVAITYAGSPALPGEV